MKIYSLIGVLLTYVTFTASCSTDADKKSDELILKYHGARDSLMVKYNAIQVRDSSLNKYTYLYQEKFINEKQSMAFNGVITDIFKQDSNYVLLLANSDVNDKFIARVIIHSQKMDKLKTQISKNRMIGGCFILNVTKIIPLGPALELNYNEGESGDEEHEGTDPYISLGEFGDEKILIFKSTLVDYYLRKY